MTTKRKRSADETRAALMEIALRMFQLEGYEKTSAKRVCAELGISGPSVYYHFSSKNELLIAAFTAQLKAMLQAHERISGDLDVLEQFWTFVALHVRLQFGARNDEEYAGPYSFNVTNLKAMTDPTEHIELEKIQRQYLGKLTDLIRAGIREAQFTRVHPTATAFAIFGMNSQASLWFRPNGSLSMADLSYMYADFAIRIVGAEPPSRRTRLCRLIEFVLSKHEFPVAGATAE